MDPQQRLLLELAWEAFEDAGVRPADMRGSNCGVFVGAASMDYGNRNMDDLNVIDPYSATGNTLSIASNRVSYLFDLRGRACPSTRPARRRCRTPPVKALQSGEADVALAGGVNLLLHPFGFVSFSKASMLSPRGRAARSMQPATAMSARKAARSCCSSRSIARSPTATRSTR